MFPSFRCAPSRACPRCAHQASTHTTEVKMRRRTAMCIVAVCLPLGLQATARAAVRDLPRILQGADVTQRPSPADPTLGTEASADTFVFGPYDFDSGWQGWTRLDLTQNALVYPHIVNLTTVPGSRGNAFVSGGGFTGLVEWSGKLGANACGETNCYPGYENGADQMLFKSFTIVNPTTTLSYKYREDSELNYDYTRVIVSTAGAPT